MNGYQWQTGVYWVRPTVKDDARLAKIAWQKQGGNDDSRSHGTAIMMDEQQRWQFVDASMPHSLQIAGVDFDVLEKVSEPLPRFAPSQSIFKRRSDLHDARVWSKRLDEVRLLEWFEVVFPTLVQFKQVYPSCIEIHLKVKTFRCMPHVLRCLANKGWRQAQKAMQGSNGITWRMCKKDDPKKGDDYYHGTFAIVATPATGDELSPAERKTSCYRVQTGVQTLPTYKVVCPEDADYDLALAEEGEVEHAASS